MTTITVMSQNVQYGARAQGRWEALVEAVRAVRPTIVLLQEVNELADPEQARKAAADLGMQLTVAPSRNLPVAVAWQEETLKLAGVETKYSLELHHGYCGPRFHVPGLPAPLVVISTHLTPYSAQGAAIEAQMLIARAYRYGGLGLVGGDINHPPLPVAGEPEPAWERMPPYNRASRCLPRAGENEPWQADTIVGARFRDGDMVDVAATVALQRGDLSLLEPTGKAGLLRVDQLHVTAALAPAIGDYERVDVGDASDHFGLLATLDLTRIDETRLRPYA
ncbi:hypothetical protein GCM10022224_080470 [Nonomuraea antimicrobica]|uniref:Metal-dependent hydrolase, endonuclease/exonuclease/phosphatase family n=1 Tax=Nonomuraea antimicrobica TaxID=561173 RepID=A0ABP7D9M0_9ACTN